MLGHVYERMWGVLLGQGPVTKNHEELFAEAFPSTIDRQDLRSNVEQ